MRSAIDTDLGVGEAARDLEEDLVLAFGQQLQAIALPLIWAPGHGQTVGVGGQQPAGHARRNHGVAACDGAYARQQVGRRGVLEEEATRPGPQCRIYVLVEVEGGEDDDPRRALGFDDLAGGLHAVHLGHAHVHQHHVRRQPLRGLDRLAAVRSLTDYLDVWLGVHHHAKRHPHQLLIVGEQHAGRHREALWASGFSCR